MITSVIIGAGFSKCASLPTQVGFPKYFISEELSNTPLHKSITNIIKQFLIDIFGWEEGEEFPTLEDYFTCLDLSANSGHNLGFKYSPKKLRAIRRITIYRIFQILDHQYNRSEAIEKLLSYYLRKGKTRFIVTNWDIVLERALIDLRQLHNISYGFECFDWSSGAIRERNEDSIIISKMHGSSNWVYCETCTKIYFDLYRKLALHERVGIFQSDFNLFYENNSLLSLDMRHGIRKCLNCGNKTLASHIATFSYKKSYRTFAYPIIWHNAQTSLSESDEWVFIGYSLPDSDYEFKHMLKASELSFLQNGKKTSPSIIVILKDDTEAQLRYKRFFGDKLLVENIHQAGLEQFVKKHILNNIDV